MLALLLLFLTTHAVFSADPKCPDGYTHVKRTPTFYNNHTTHWCLGVFAYENMGNRDRARSACISNNAMLSIPENQQEYDTLAKVISKMNVTAYIAIDGEVNPRCKARIFQTIKREEVFNYTTEFGMCNVNSALFEFDDRNSDPKFVLSRFEYGYPHHTVSIQFGSAPKYIFITGCLSMVDVNEIQPKSGKRGAVSSNFCVGHKSVSDYTDHMSKGSAVNAVVCGRHPL